MKEATEEKLLNLVKRNYKDIAALFNQTRRKEIWPEIRKFSADVKDGDRVLDVGCGNGRLLEALAGKQLFYLGVDNSPELIKIARINYPGRQFAVADILKLTDLPETGFDYIFCLAVLQHIPGRRLRAEALKQLAAKLNPGGRIVISVWNLWSNAWDKKRYRFWIFKTWFGGLVNAKKRVDFGDLIFPWKDARGRVVSPRYYHAFTIGELGRIVKISKLQINLIKKDQFNYWLILK